MAYYHLTYWAKTSSEDPTLYHPIAYHSLDVAAVFTLLIREDPRLKVVADALLLCEESARIPILQFFAACHDIGKFSNAFQMRAPELLYALQGREISLPDYTPHTNAGHFLFEKKLFNILCDSGNSPLFIGGSDTFDADLWDLLHPIISAATGHHGSPPSSSRTTLKRLYPEEVLEDISVFIQECRDLFFQNNDPVILTYSEANMRKISGISYLYAGILVLSDWIASNISWFGFVQNQISLTQYWEEYALPQARRAIDETGILPVPPADKAGFSHLFPKITTPHPVQNLSDTLDLAPGPGLYIIEDQCGMGKTEAGLVLAHRLMSQGAGEGIFFALPTMATADAIYQRLGEFYTHLFDPSADQPEIVLTHSMSNFLGQLTEQPNQKPASMKSGDPSEELSSSSEAASWLSDSRKKALLAHVGVGTIDQALMAILPYRHQSMRLLGLMRNVLVIDEVHSYDSYVHSLLCALIRFHASYGGSAILLSATLPLITKSDLVEAFREGVEAFSPQESPAKLPSSKAYPLVTVCTGSPIREIAPPLPETPLVKPPVAITIVHTWDEIVSEMKEAISEGKCLAYIRNTVDDAREAYQALIPLIGQDRLTLFHARFLYHDRSRRESELLSLFGKGSNTEQRRGRVVIATQVIEQSLDLDFDLMISDLAPIDLLIQRAGRVHRHNLAEPYRLADRGVARLIVYAPPLDPVSEDWYQSLFPRGAKVYPDHGRLYLTSKALSSAGEIHQLNVRTLIEEVYDEESKDRIPAELMGETMSAQVKDKTDETVALLNALVLHNGYLFTEEKWNNDLMIPTRLSELSTPLFLGRQEGEKIVPLYGEGLAGWYMSRILIPDRMIPGSAYQDHPVNLVPPIPYQQGGVVVMEQDGSGWSGYVDQKKRILVRYDNIAGFVVEKL